MEVMRPDDVELLKQASRDVTRRLAGSVVFAGLRHRDRVPVSTVAGGHADRLKSIVLAPSRGLGGRSWQALTPLAVADYAGSTEITHDFDDQILGEGITALAVAPIVVRRDLRGLIYVGQRRAAASLGDLIGAVSQQASAVAHELLIRDGVDQRMLMHASRLAAPPASTQAHELAELHAQLRAIAGRIDDAALAEELRSLTRVRGGEPEFDLTSRQVDVLALVALGLKNADIASRLGLTVTTVKSYLREAMTRMSVSTRHEAVGRARRAGYLP
jgi:LuxR family transcriptional regulator, regulator of acetate metabolism